MKRLTRAQREVLEQLTWSTKLSAYLPRSKARTARALERMGLIVQLQDLPGILVLGKYRLTSRGWAAVGRAPCRGVG